MVDRNRDAVVIIPGWFINFVLYILTN